jgi:hypothetical protein
MGTSQRTLRDTLRNKEDLLLVVHQIFLRSPLRNRALIVSMSVSPATRKEFLGICSPPKAR